MKDKTVYFLKGYAWISGTIISEGPKRYKVKTNPAPFINSHEAYVPKDKCAFPEELVCIVCESWKGTYKFRIEKTMYPEHRVPARSVHQQPSPFPLSGRVEEKCWQELLVYDF